MIGLTPLLLSVGGGYLLATMYRNLIMENLHWIFIGVGGLLLLSSMRSFNSFFGILHSLIGGLLVGKGIYLMMQDNNGSSE